MKTRDIPPITDLKLWGDFQAYPRLIANYINKNLVPESADCGEWESVESAANDLMEAAVNFHTAFSVATAKTGKRPLSGDFYRFVEDVP